MKHFFSFVLLILFASLSYSQKENIKKIKTDIGSITIYLDGAEISRAKNVQLPKGKTRVIFENLSSKLNSKSIQVTTTGDVSILAISNKINHLTDIEDKPKIKLLKDSVEYITGKISSSADSRGALVIEKEMLIKNESIGGEANGVSIVELKQAAEFFRSRINDINSRISGIDKDMIDHKKSLKRVTKQLTEFNAQYNYDRMEVSILLLAEEAVSSKIDLKYLVSDAGWTPAYDIRAENINKPIELKYSAKLFNNTGIDWKNVKFKLSSGDPTLTASQPTLKPWYLNYDTQASISMLLENQEGYMQNAAIEFDDFNTRKIIQKGEITYEEIEVSELSAEFDIKTKYSIPSDAKPYLVEVTEYNLPAIYKHFAIAKLDRDAFLLARITGWENLNLVEGPANIYFGGTYIGQSYIYTRSINDTLDLSLGRDKKILVTRTKLKDYSSTKFIGTNRKETYTYEIVVKNNRETPIQIEIQDQLPVSQHSDIIVSAIEVSKAEYEELTGKLKWEYKLGPGTSQKIKLSFSIKYPKNKPIIIQQTKKKMRAMF